MSGSLFYGGTSYLDFYEFYATWSRIVNQNCLPLCRRQQLSSAAPASVPSTNIETVLERLDWYYGKLDSFAKNDPKTIPLLLFPSWRNHLETPILFLGDLNPYLLTSLFRSITNRENQDSKDELLKRIEDETKIKISVLLNQMMEAQMRFGAIFSENWVSTYQLQSQTVMETAVSVVVVDEAGKQEMKNFANIFVEANLIRKEVIKDIVTSADDHLAALFLEALFGLFAAFKDEGRRFHSQQHPPGPAHGFPRPVQPHYSTFPIMNQPQHPPGPAHFPLVPVPVPSNDRTLWMGDVKDNMDSDFLTTTCFAPSDGVVSAKVIRDNETGRRNGFIEFGTWPAAKRALRRYNNAEIPGVFPIKLFRLNWSRLRAEYTIYVGNLSSDVTANVLEIRSEHVINRSGLQKSMFTLSQGFAKDLVLLASRM